MTEVSADVMMMSEFDCEECVDCGLRLMEYGLFVVVLILALDAGAVVNDESEMMIEISVRKIGLSG
jgi:hypothetical protein